MQHLANERVLFQKLGHGETVCMVRLHAQVQRFETLIESAIKGTGLCGTNQVTAIDKEAIER